LTVKSSTVDWEQRVERAKEMVDAFNVAKRDLLLSLREKQEEYNACASELQYRSTVVQTLSRLMPLNDVFNIWFGKKKATDNIVFKA
jgi:hypothetical protein